MSTSPPIHPQPLFQLLLATSKELNGQDKDKRKTQKALTDGVVMNDHKTSFYNW